MHTICRRANIDFQEGFICDTTEIPSVPIYTALFIIIILSILKSELFTAFRIIYILLSSAFRSLIELYNERFRIHGQENRREQDIELGPYQSI